MTEDPAQPQRPTLRRRPKLAFACFALALLSAAYLYFDPSGAKSFAILFLGVGLPVMFGALFLGAKPSKYDWKRQHEDSSRVITDPAFSSLPCNVHHRSGLTEHVPKS